ncbi:hypothetical protein PV332_10570 [Streptomyces scabiei]|uniref:hypothetical protein n=1 Tax=Streptomyces scabiei TaxID=1930 RepID=UPI0029A23857|nr:hypothetical protein [Streptomyces scabiei]MDX2575924.1 hypothetical protein [Streptomyces scabiei]MDX2794031.1 hypothetical protein [Streptomyces scabiei]MDX2885603.1 hypothetical protein [Streptomyces scabiei]MDX2993444.1 hypothetical protein [Streptomyces scabiei]MDX3028442.1 hypothetical protein [Streptomyces scabiei]
MALFLVSRTDRVDYEEHDAIVVRAGDEATAMKIATNGTDPYGDGEFWDADFNGFKRDGSNLTVERLESGGPDGVILKSFRAG